MVLQYYTNNTEKIKTSSFREILKNSEFAKVGHFGQFHAVLDISVEIYINNRKDKVDIQYINNLYNFELFDCLIRFLKID